MRMYHSTSIEAAEKIKDSGSIRGPVYLTPKLEIAEEYGANNSSDFVIIAVDVDEALFCADLEFVKCGDDALAESLENGSVYVDGDVAVASAEFIRYEDYEAV